MFIKKISIKFNEQVTKFFSIRIKGFILTPIYLVPLFHWKGNNHLLWDISQRLG